MNIGSEGFGEVKISNRRRKVVVPVEMYWSGSFWTFDSFERKRGICMWGISKESPFLTL
jgi:hypothetical protein